MHFGAIMISARGGGRPPLFELGLRLSLVHLGTVQILALLGKSKLVKILKQIMNQGFLGPYKELSPTYFTRKFV